MHGSTGRANMSRVQTHEGHLFFLYLELLRRDDMTDPSADTAENVYLAVYDVVAENGDYFQPGGNTKLLLPEAIIVSVVTTVLTSFLQGLFQKAGESVFSTFKRRIESMKETEPEQGELVQLLREALPKIQELKLAASDAREEVTRVLHEDAHLSEAKSRELAESLIEVIALKVNTHA